MIAGIGTDIAAVARLGKLYERHGERALEKFSRPPNATPSPEPPTRRAFSPSASPPRKRLARRSALALPIRRRCRTSR